MIDRIFKNWKTSAIGIGVILFCLALIWTGRVSLTEGLAGMSTALIFFYIKDVKDNNPSSLNK